MRKEGTYILGVSRKILKPIDEGEVPQGGKEKEVENPRIHLQEVWRTASIYTGIAHMPLNPP